MPNNRELISLDLGQAKTGLARASTIALLAEPLGSVETHQLAKKLKELMDESDIEAVVVGLPRNLEGDDTAQTRWVREFVAKLKTEVKATFYWQDEALTTQVSMKTANGKHDDHALAAQVILQDWIDTPTDERVLC